MGSEETPMATSLYLRTPINDETRDTIEFLLRLMMAEEAVLNGIRAVAEEGGSELSYRVFWSASIAGEAIKVLRQENTKGLIANLPLEQDQHRSFLHEVLTDPKTPRCELAMSIRDKLMLHWDRDIIRNCLRHNEARLRETPITEADGLRAPDCRYPWVQEIWYYYLKEKHGGEFGGDLRKTIKEAGDLVIELSELLFALIRATIEQNRLELPILPPDLWNERANGK
jgi:hypothetical protein